MRVSAQLAFNGVCRAAFENYAEVLGGKIVVMNTFGRNDAALPPGSEASAPEHIRFAMLDIDGSTILGNDVPAHQYRPMQGFSMALHLSSVSEAERIFKDLARAGDVLTPLSPVAWAKRFGMLRDRFGTPWLILATRDSAAADDGD